MNAIAKFGIAALVAFVLLLTPIGFCADSVVLNGTPSHPCCPAKPASLPDDCARPGCIYMDTSVVPVATTVIDDAGSAWTFAPSPIRMEGLSEATTARSIPLERLAPAERVVVFHQFRI